MEVRGENMSDLIIKNPGVPRESKYLQIAKKNNISIETDVSIFFQLCPSKIIGVTGTKGKSTTTTLIYNIFKNAKLNPLLAGNIRISPLSILSKTSKSTPIIMELSSWQLEDMAHIKMSPHISVVTNVLPDHLNRYKNITQYSESKKLIYKFQKTNDALVLNINNDLVKKFNNIKSKKYFISTKTNSINNGCFVKNGWIVYRKDKKDNIIIPLKDIKVPGQHNLENVMLAITASKVYGVNNKIIRDTIKKFKGISDRLELIRQWKGYKFYNDTTATAPQATEAALNCFKQRVILIAGGTDKNLNFSTLAKLIKIKSEYTILFEGSATNKIVIQFNKLGYMNYEIVNTMNKAVSIALKKANNSTIILLSPGAASFGIFQNEFDRGDQFKQAIKKLK